MPQVMVREIITTRGNTVLLKSKTTSKVLGRFPFGKGKKYASKETAIRAAKKREGQVQLFKKGRLKEHLGGKHNEKTHGRRKGKGGGGKKVTSAVTIADLDRMKLGQVDNTISGHPIEKINHAGAFSDDSPAFFSLELEQDGKPFAIEIDSKQVAAMLNQSKSGKPVKLIDEFNKAEQAKQSTRGVKAETSRQKLFDAAAVDPKSKARMEAADSRVLQRAKTNLQPEVVKVEGFEQGVANRSWATESNTTNYSRGFQNQISSDFNAPMSGWQNNIKGSTAPGSVYTQGQVAARKLGRAQYNETQTYLKSNNIKEVRLYRGMTNTPPPPWVTGKGKLEQNALESWTTSREVAKQFAGGFTSNGSQAVLTSAIIPANKIYSVAGVTGSFGATLEREIVILSSASGPISVEMIVQDRF